MVERESVQEYHARRAPEYDQVYEKPERQGDLRALRALVDDLLCGKDVLELACGTGYWTRVISAVAKSVVASDICPEVLSVARAGVGDTNAVTLTFADAMKLADIPGDFTAAFAGFWWSHVPRKQLRGLLAGLRDRLGAGARLVFMDNRYVEGSSTPIAGVDFGGSSFQVRHPRNGTRYRY